MSLSMAAVLQLTGAGSVPTGLLVKVAWASKRPSCRPESALIGIVAFQVFPSAASWAAWGWARTWVPFCSMETETVSTLPEATPLRTRSWAWLLSALMKGWELLVIALSSREDGQPGSAPSSPSKTVSSPGRFGSGTCADHSIIRSEEHTSELQSRQYLVCRLLLEKK